MRKMLYIFISILICLSINPLKAIDGNYELDSLVVKYVTVVRDIDQTVNGTTYTTEYDDTDATYDIVVSWPAAGENALFSYGLPYYDVGDTIGVIDVPLGSAAALANFGLGLNTDFSAGNFTINQGSVYPTTNTVDCVTSQVFLQIQDAGTWTDNGHDPLISGNSFRWGWGIITSNVFATFSAPDMVNDVYGQDYGLMADGSETAMPNWGYIQANYTDATNTVVDGLNIGWEAHDGPDAGIGIVSDGDPYFNQDEADLGLLNGMVGRSSIPADTVTIKNMQLYGQSLATPVAINVPTDHPPIMFGGPGNTNTTTGEVTGVIDTSWGYIFDPTGDLLGGGDGVPFSGDEALKFTGYYATWNTLITLQGIESGLYAAGMAGHTTPATFNVQGIVDSVLSEVLYNWGFDDASYAVLAADQNNNNIADVTEAVVGYINGWLTDGDDLETIAGKLLPTILGFVTQTQATMTTAGSPLRHDDESADDAGDGTIVVVDDSGHDLANGDFYVYYEEPWNYVGGRLYVQLEANCFPAKWSQYVDSHWTNTALVASVDPGVVAEKFELKGNYPNPFNPTTKIRFSNDRSSNVKVTIYSLKGEKVATLMNKKVNAGTYDVTWNGKNSKGKIVPTGMYLYNVESDQRTLQGKMLFLK